MQNKEIRILMIDDDEEDFMIINDVVSEIDHHKFLIDWVPTYEEGLTKISEKKYEVYLVDFRLGKRTGLELIAEAVKGGCEEPLIVLTGLNDFAIDMAAMNAGASDYMVKGTINAQGLESSIRYAIANAQHKKELKKLNGELEERVKQRTLILEETLKDLEKSQGELNEMLAKERGLNELKSRFVSTVSHEFRTPLGIILSSLSLISEYGLKQDFESQAKHIKKIKLSVNNLTELLNDLLCIGELEEGKISAAPEIINITDLMGELIREMDQLTKAGQTIHYHHSGCGEAFLNKKIIRHILLNLVSNAIKFSEENKPINIVTGIENSSFLIIVEDKGIGISEKDQNHLFERFFRGKNAINIKGTGLGLNITAGYVKMLNGSIEVFSDIGMGTVIKIKLPICSESIAHASDLQIAKN